jgi:hypothetical protein
MSRDRAFQLVRLTPISGQLLFMPQKRAAAGSDPAGRSGLHYDRKEVLIAVSGRSSEHSVDVASVFYPELARTEVLGLSRTGQKRKRNKSGQNRLHSISPICAAKPTPFGRCAIGGRWGAPLCARQHSSRANVLC